jgi:hypothetical protein
MKDIDKMTDWEILTYLRQNREWMVQSHYSKHDIENMYGITFDSEEDWIEFTNRACESFDYVKHDLMSVIVDNLLITETK